MDILSKLPLIGKSQDEANADTLSEEEARKQRIQFHREKVRNGPTSFRHITNGMVRRAQIRDLNRRTRKARKAQIKNYFETHRLAAVVRGHLQTALVLPYVYERSVPPVETTRSAVWLVQRFGVEGEDGSVSFAHDDVLTALGNALRFYGQAVGLPNLQVPEGYVVPVYELGTEPEVA